MGDKLIRYIFRSYLLRNKNLFRVLPSREEENCDTALQIYHMKPPLCHFYSDGRSGQIKSAKTQNCVRRYAGRRPENPQIYISVRHCGGSRAGLGFAPRDRPTRQHGVWRPNSDVPCPCCIFLFFPRNISEIQNVLSSCRAGRQILEQFPVASFSMVRPPVGPSRKEFWWHCPFNVKKKHVGRAGLARNPELSRPPPLQSSK